MMNWYAIYTKPGSENSTAQLLDNAGVKTLAPKMLTTKYFRGKYIRVAEQLFPSYIFAFFDPDTDIRLIRYTRGVKYIVGKDSPLAVHPEIISAITDRMEGDIVKPFSENFTKGDRVLIREGPFKNFYGIFEKNIPGRERAMILLEALHCKMNIESTIIKKA